MAAHLVDEVLPEVPIRQWVCSLPWRLRYAMGYDKKLCADVLAAFVGALRSCLRRRAKREFGLSRVADEQFGGLTFIQRAGLISREALARSKIGRSEVLYAAVCLAEAEVEYMLVGGYAVMAHGYLRATQDLDV